MKKIIIIEIAAGILVCAIAVFTGKTLLEMKDTDESSNDIITSTFDEESASQSLEESGISEADTSTDSAEFTITLSFVGDCLLATDEYTYYENCFEDVADEKKPSYFFKNVSDIFLNDDFTVADCENVFSDSEDLSVSDKGQYDDPDIEAYWFKSAKKNAEILSVGGIDCVSISNNHIDDYGEQGHLDTQEALDEAGLLWGEEGKIVYYEKNGFKIAVICVSMYGEYQLDSVKSALKKAKKKSDYQIIYFHGGTEAVHEPEEWKVNACHELADAGADLIMGDHPHVLQPMEEYNGVTIIYSLGNFIFGGNRHPENRTVIYQHVLTIEENSVKSEDGTLIPCYVYTGDTNNWQPAIIEDESTIKKVLRFMSGKRELPY